MFLPEVTSLKIYLIAKSLRCLMKEQGELKTHKSRKLSSANEGGAKKIRGGVESGHNASNCRCLPANGEVSVWNCEQKCNEKSGER